MSLHAAAPPAHDLERHRAARGFTFNPQFTDDNAATSGHVAEYEIAGRRMKYRSGAEILQQINHWKGILASEKRAERIAAGLGGGNKILVRL